MEARECGRALKPDYGDFILPPAAMRRTHQQFRDCGGFPRFPKKKVWATKSLRDKETKRLRVKETKSQKDKESRRQREEETKRERVKERKRRREDLSLEGCTPAKMAARAAVPEAHTFLRGVL